MSCSGSGRGARRLNTCVLSYVMLGVTMGVAALPGCASPGAAGVHGGASDESVALGDRLTPASRAGDPAAAARDLAAARRTLGRGERGAAVLSLEDLVRREPRYLPAHRLLQDLLVDSPSDWDVRRIWLEKD